MPPGATSPARSPDTGGVTFQTGSFPNLPRPVPKPTTPATATASEPRAATPPAERNGSAESNGSAEHNGSTANGSWVEPDEGSCPLTHPIKAKLSSGIFHEPGGGNYDRIRAERCYVDPDAAIADGLRAPSASHHSPARLAGSFRGAARSPERR